jgi:hypothetical protein
LFVNKIIWLSKIMISSDNNNSSQSDTKIHTKKRNNLFDISFFCVYCQIFQRSFYNLFIPFYNQNFGTYFDCKQFFILRKFVGTFLTNVKQTKGS